jgi:hypothetical protein
MDGCGMESDENGDGADRRISRVLILGGGFGGIYTALKLEKLLRWRKDISVTLVTRDNFFLFTPMLHEVAASDLEINAIVSPLRKLLKRVGTFVGNVEAVNLRRAWSACRTVSTAILTTWASITSFWPWAPAPTSSAYQASHRKHSQFVRSTTRSPCAAA